MQHILKAFLKNIDVYIVIAAAIAFSLLGIIGTVSVQIVLSSTLAILAVLAYSILKNRQDNETVEKTLEHLIKTLPNKNALYETNLEAYKILEDYVNSHHVQLDFEQNIQFDRKGLSGQFRRSTLMNIYKGTSGS